jgi:hypothetical protein
LTFLLVEGVTLARYGSSQRKQLTPYIRGTARASGSGPLTRLGRVFLETQRLALLQSLVLGADLLRLGLAMACFGAFVQDRLVTALALVAVCFLGLEQLYRLTSALRQKLHAFHHYDGVVLTREPASPGGRSRLLPETGLARSLDGWLDGLLYPPVCLQAKQSIHLLESRLEIDLESPCKVCGQVLGEEELVLCARCKTPHHRACFEYAGKCSVYGCGCDVSEAISA